MARRNGHNRGIVLKDGKWWARVYVAGREKWYRADNKSQAKAIYARIQAEKREMRYFPEQFDPVKTITLRAWISRCLEGMASRGLRNMPHYGKFWQRLLGPMPLAEISAGELRFYKPRWQRDKPEATAPSTAISPPCDDSSTWLWPKAT